MAKAIGISPANSIAATTAYDPACGSGSLLLKVAAEAGKHITLEGQEKDVTTAGLARMNMILHDFPTANVISGNTLFDPKFKDGEQLRTYDYVVANPPFSDKTWTTGLTPSKDPFQRFAWGEPPAKKGDYAYLLHIVRSMKGAGKAACILPHGVLFRGNVEACPGAIWTHALAAVATWDVAIQNAMRHLPWRMLRIGKSIQNHYRYIQCCCYVHSCRIYRYYQRCMCNR